MVGSGQADCQKASPRYSRSSQRLHWTAVNQKRMQSTADSPSLSFNFPGQGKRPLKLDDE